MSIMKLPVQLLNIPVQLLNILMTIIVSTPALAQEAEQSSVNNRNKPTMSTAEPLKRASDSVIVSPDFAYRDGDEAWKLHTLRQRW